MLKDAVTSVAISVLKSCHRPNSRSILVLVVDVECLNVAAHHDVNRSCFLVGPSDRCTLVLPRR